MIILCNKYLNEKYDDARFLYKKQRNVCVFLCKKAKKENYENLDLYGVTDSKKFWKSVKQVFRNLQSCNTISSIVKYAVISAEEKLAMNF